MVVELMKKCRLDTRAEVLRDLDAEWEVADDVIVTEAQPRSLYIIQDRPRGSYIS